MNRRNLTLTALACLLSSMGLLLQARQIPKAEIPRDLVRQLIADINTNKNNVRLSQADLTILRRSLKHELHDLDGDGASEFFLFIEHSDWCGAGSNCSYWVYRKTEEGYSLLVKDAVLRVQEIITNGFRDLASETPVGFCAENVQRLSVTPYKYDGAKYRRQLSKMECRVITSK